MANSPNIFSLLIEAASLGDDSAVDQLLSGEELLSVEEASRPETRLGSKNFGLTALHRARTPEVAKALLDFGVPVDCKGAFGQTPLHTCCENPAVIRMLLDRGANVEAITEDGSTPLEWAVLADSVESARLLLERGANVQCKNNSGNTPLHLVVSKRMTELLLSFGAKVSTENNDGKIPLETATERKGDSDFTAITELLLEVSEDRGLRFRTRRNSATNNANDSENWFKSSASNGKEDVKARAKAKWAFVKKNLVQGRRKQILATNNESKRTISIACEWTKEDPQSGVSGRFSISQASVRATDGEEDIEQSGNSQKGIARTTSSGGDQNGDRNDEDNLGSNSSDSDNEDDSRYQGENGEFYRTFFEMAIRERPFLAKKMLDRQRVFLYSKGTSKYYMYDLSLLGGIDSVSEALRLIVEHDRRDLVAHDVVQWLVTAKWGLFIQGYIHHEAAMYILFMVLFIMHALYPWLPENVTAYENWIDLGLVIFSLRYMYRLFLEWKHRGATWEVAMSIFRSDKFTGPVFLIVLVVQVLDLLSSEHSSYAREVRMLEMIGSVMLWLRVLYFVEPQYQPIGLTMSIVRKMIVDIMVYLIILFVFLLGFSQAMTVAFRPEKEIDDPHASVNQNYASPLASFRTLLFFIFSMDQSTVVEEEDDSKRTLGMVLLAMYETLVVIVFLNLVIAVMTTSFEDVMSNAQTEWLLVRAKICVKLEDQTNAWFVSRSLDIAKRGRRRHFKNRVVVAEHASGENEVSLPISMLPPTSGLRRWIHEGADVLRRLYAKVTRSEYEPLPATTSGAPAKTTRRPRGLSTIENPAIQAITGWGESIVCVGKFIRHSSSVANLNSTGEGSADSAASLFAAVNGGGRVGTPPAAKKDMHTAVELLKKVLTELEGRE